MKYVFPPQMPNMYRNQSRTNEQSKKNKRESHQHSSVFSVCVYFVLMEKDTNSIQQQTKETRKEKNAKILYWNTARTRRCGVKEK